MRYWASLHNHTIYSVNDALAKPKQYVEKIHSFNYENGNDYFVGMAICEHGNLSSILKNREACLTEIQLDKNKEPKKLKPVYGIEIYHSFYNTQTDSKFNSTKQRKLEKENNTKIDERTTDQRFHLVLLAKDNEGNYNMTKICSHAGLNSYTAYKTYNRTDISFMRENGKGVIALSACLGGYIPQLLLNGEYDRAKEVALEFKSIFEHFYLEIQANEIPEQLILNPLLIKLSQETDIGLVITCDSHYVNREDKETHDILYSISQLSDDKKNKEIRIKGLPDYAHFQTPLEIEKYCIDWGIPLSAMDNTVDIFHMCNVDFKPTDVKTFMPKFNVPKGYTEETYLEYLTYSGLYKNIQNKSITDDLEVRLKRLKYELSVVNNAGFAGYFLIVSDFVKKCKENGILVGPGRGSAAGSIIAYILGITNIDPIKYNLLYERFMNPERTSFPD